MREVPLYGGCSVMRPSVANVSITFGGADGLGGGRWGVKTRWRPPDRLRGTSMQPTELKREVPDHRGASLIRNTPPA